MNGQKNNKAGTGENKMIKNLRERLYGDAEKGSTELLNDEEKCIFCGNFNNLIKFKDTYICRKCLEDI
ncbi:MULTISPECIES: hypothetical protein [unclassified Halanaerobium]|uniref:hypothetical protein n=1 Tax=unclassified Halanaerobium TaxID=2641197 RepID=UPI000DF1FD65|nr:MULTISPECIES: hypothetical protein [unclassified Halanaerobium]RCW40290.1 hypothetical protein DFR78_1534 [Halanaerobium sp. MA284_MarDTE_T2]RCW79863.1 hypothetical protein DER71_1341 [Halanaerobium sp. DL-01]